MEQLAISEGETRGVGAVPGVERRAPGPLLVGFARSQGASCAAVLGAAHGHTLLGSVHVAAVVALERRRS